ncbi:MAG: hypothetical protein Q9190_007994, partial [Brigantiaea leucoxantha]
MSDSTSKPKSETPNDTSFRKTWDRTLYAQQAASRAANEKEESALRSAAKAEGKKYHHRPPPDPSTLTDSSSRTARLAVTNSLGRTTFIPSAGAGAGSVNSKRGRGAGFYCPDCDLTYKDNLQFVDHLNSKQHLFATGQSGE